MAPNIPEISELGLDQDAQTVDELARDVLGDGYFHFTLKRVSAVENIAEMIVHVDVELVRSGVGEALVLSGDGVGVVDAFVAGFLHRFAPEYPSLNSVNVVDFSITGSRAHSKKAQGTDALATATLRIGNSEGIEFVFVAETPSITHSSIRVALLAFTFFVNAERAYISLHKALADATTRRRADLVERYRSQMSVLVGATSYADVMTTLSKSDT